VKTRLTSPFLFPMRIRFTFWRKTSSRLKTSTIITSCSLSDRSRKLTNFYYINVLSSVFKIAAVWGGEVIFRVTISGNAITGRYVDILAQRGSTTGKRFEYSKDITTIKRKVASARIKLPNTWASTVKPRMLESRV